MISSSAGPAANRCGRSTILRSGIYQAVDAPGSDNARENAAAFDASGLLRWRADHSSPATCSAIRIQA